MRKLLILSRQSMFDINDLEHYLYDTEASRDDFLDMDPVNVKSGKLSEGTYHYSEWDLAQKDKETHDYLHVAFCGDDEFVFENAYLTRLSKFVKVINGTHAVTTAVLHKSKRTIVIVRMTKKISELFTACFEQLLGSVDNEVFTEELAELLGIPRSFCTEEID